MSAPTPDLAGAVAQGEETVDAVEEAVAHPSGTGAVKAIQQGYLLEQRVAPIVQETRRSWKTTEFWTSLGTALTVLVTSIPVHDKLYLSIVAAVYALARGLAKAGTPNVEAPGPTPPV